jgi:hypothetical protein
LVFDNVTVIDVQQGRELPAQRVVIVGTRIRAVGRVEAVRVPPGARVVDARDKYLIPGLWDMHTHLESLANEVYYPLFIANGVTGIRDAGSPVPLDTFIQWRREILAGRRVGPPRQLLSGRSIAGPERGCDRSKLGDRLQTCVTDAADTRHVVDSLAAAGADMIKPRDINRNLWFVVAAEARRIGIPFGGHTQDETWIEASDSGARIVDHIIHRSTWVPRMRCVQDSATVTRCQPVAAHFRRNGTWLVPTLVAFGTRLTGILKGKGQYAQAISLRWIARVDSVLAGTVHGNWLRDVVRPGPPPHDTSGAMYVIHRVGLPLLVGSDAGVQLYAGFALQAELAENVAEGVTPLEALQAATLNPAKMLHGTDSLGTVAPGKLADLVLLDADPLADITNTTTIRAVVANGRYFDRAALDTVLADAHARATQAPSP